MESADFVIVGGGLAGASLAYQLCRRGAGSVALVEQEPAFGTQASAQNAAMVRQLVEDEAVAALAREGARFLETPPADLAATLDDLLAGAPLMRRTGSVLVAGTRAGRRSLIAMAEAARRAGVEASLLEPAQVGALAPGVDPGALSGGAWCPEDGVTDPQALVDAFLRRVREMGGRALAGVRAESARLVGERIVAVETDRGTIPCGTAIDAAGAWASRVAASLGAPTPDLLPHRRHIAVSSPLEGFGDWPIVWDVERGFYARPESGRLLFCACDEDPVPAGVPREDPAVLESMAAKAAALLPGVELTVARSWAGLRTFTGDRRFVIGPDPQVGGLHWLAGLGGHGVTVSGAVGRLAADLLLDPLPPPEAASFDPARLAPCRS
jgi:glycine/D-amino acid oxidase-like deaminating enzyme